jgi:hypothetical protein
LAGPGLQPVAEQVESVANHGGDSGFPVEVARLDLPAGSFAVSAKLTVTNSLLFGPFFVLFSFV